MFIIDSLAFNIWGVVLATIGILLYVVAHILSFVRNSKKPLRLSLFSSAVVFFISLIFVNSGATYEGILISIVAFLTTWQEYRYAETALRERYHAIRVDWRVRADYIETEILLIILFILCFLAGGIVRYHENVIMLEPEVNKTVYCFGENAEIGNEAVYFSESPEGDIVSVPIEVVLVAGLTQEYMERTDVYHYSEDRNVEPPKRDVASTETTCRIYINRDRYYELCPGNAAVDVLADWE